MKSLNIKSLNISILLHVVLIVVISMIMRSPVEKAPIKKIIFMNFDSISPNLGRAGGTVVKDKQVAQVDSKIVVKNNTAIASSPASESTATGNGESVGAGNGSGAVGSGVFESSVINYSEPLYPRIAIKRGIEGNLRLKIKVGPEGIPIETSILKSSGSDLLDNAAIEAVKRWVFKKNESSSFYYVEKIIVFEIKK